MGKRTSSDQQEMNLAPPAAETPAPAAGDPPADPDLLRWADDGGPATDTKEAA